MASKGKGYVITTVQPESQDTLTNFKQYIAQHTSDERVTDGLPTKLKRTLPSREHLFGDVTMDKNKKIFSLDTICSGWKIQNRNASEINGNTKY